MFFYVAIFLPFAFSLFLFAFSFVLTLREVQLTWPYRNMLETPPAVNHASLQIKVDQQNPFVPPPNEEGEREILLTEFARQQCCDLIAMGYQPLNILRHAKGSLYSLRYDVLISEDHTTLAFVTCGKLLVSMRTVTFLSLTEPAKPNSELPTFLLRTMNNKVAYVVDFSGSSQTIMYNTKYSAKLENHHRQRLVGQRVIPFSDNPLDDFRHHLIRGAEWSAAHGRIRFLDAERNQWLPSIASGLKNFIGILRFQLLKWNGIDSWKYFSRR